MAISAVTDALGFGAAKVDVAYSGLHSGIDILDEIKAKIVAAREPGVDKGKIQTEIEQLKFQIKQVAQSSNFNGVNWLKTELPQDLADVASFETGVVASFVRSGQNQVSVKTINLDLSKISMIPKQAILAAAMAAFSFPALAADGIVVGYKDVVEPDPALVAFAQEIVQAWISIKRVDPSRRDKFFAPTVKTFMHMVDENVAVADLEALTGIYETFIERWFADATA